MWDSIHAKELALDLVPLDSGNGQQVCAAVRTDLFTVSQDETRTQLREDVDGEEAIVEGVLRDRSGGTWPDLPVELDGVGGDASWDPDLLYLAGVGD